MYTFVNVYMLTYHLYLPAKLLLQHYKLKLSISQMVLRMLLLVPHFPQTKLIPEIFKILPQSESKHSFSIFLCIQLTFKFYL